MIGKCRLCRWWDHECNGVGVCRRPSDMRSRTRAANPGDMTGEGYTCRFYERGRWASSGRKAKRGE